MAAGILVFITMLWATSPVAVIPLSLGMGSVIVWVFFWIQCNPNVPINHKRIAWIYWLFFLTCILKLFVAMAEAKSVNAPAMVGIMVAYVLIFSPCVLLIFGWMQWW